MLPLLLVASASALPLQEAAPAYLPEVFAGEPVEGPQLRVRSGEGLAALALAETVAIVEVHAGLARFTLHHWFEDPDGAAAGEALYLLPLPPEAAVLGLELRCGDRWLDSVLLPRAAAESAFADQGGLLAAAAPGALAWRMAEGCGEGEIGVTVEYAVPLAYEGGRAWLPLPPSAAAAVPALPWEDPLPPPAQVITVTIDEGAPVVDLRVEDGKAASFGGDERRQVAILSFDPGQSPRLSWALSGPSALAYRPDPSRPGYLVVTLPPSVLGQGADASRRELIFVIDSSCSMRGPAYEDAQQAVCDALATLSPEDTFNLYRLHGGRPPLFPAPRAPSPASRSAAARWLAQFDGRGEPGAAGLARALRDAGAPGALRALLLLSDGHLDEAALRQTLAASAQGGGGTQLFTVGTGALADQGLLARVAVRGQGSLLDGERLAEELPAALSPTLSEVALDWGGAPVSAVLPAEVPDLRADQPLLVLARYQGQGDQTATLRISGRRGGLPVVLELPVQLPAYNADYPGVATQWARQRVADLQARPDAASPAAQAEALSLALEHGLLTPQTALLALDGGTGAPLAGSEALSQQPPAALPTARAARAAPAEAPAPRKDPPKRQINMSTVGMNIATDEAGEGIRLAFERQQPQIRACYDRALKDSPDLGGTVAVQLNVVSGAVQRVRVVEDTIRDAELTACIVRRVEGWDFPAAVTDNELYLPFALSVED